MWNLIGASKACMELERQREHYLHQRKLYTIRPVVDTRPPQHHTHLSAKTGKKRKQTQERMEMIQKENEMLLGKMLQIDVRPMTTGRPLSRPSHSLHQHQRLSFSRKISAENRSLLSRLRKTNSRYSVRLWEEDHSRHSYFASQISGNSHRGSSKPDYPGNFSLLADRPATAKSSGHVRAKSARMKREEVSEGL